MKILLAAINAKYIHSNLAVYSLKAYAQEKSDNIEIAEYTINQQVDDILRDIYKKKPDMLNFSCYIWNITYVEALVREVKKILPHVVIWVGGPEVSYDAKSVLTRLPEIDGVMKGEGEETFAELVNYYKKGSGDLKEILGISYRTDTGEIVENEWRQVMDLSKVPFVYEDLSLFEHKIIYYESSRGCPFRCSYCLSSVDKCLRFRDLELVKKELQFFIEHKVPQVKFVDRTFNCKHDHAMEIWKYILDNDNGVTNFHFEVSADLLNEEELTIMKEMRPGLIQLEIGVQSTNEDTIKEIRRTMSFKKVAEKVEQINSYRNVHQHLDLIAGLPYEDYKSFGKSFDDVYALHPEQLQLGFLKVLKGSYMEQNKKEYELVYKSIPPYEVLSTKWLPYDDILRLKGIEEMVEVYYNSQQFTYTLPHLLQLFDSPFTFFEKLSKYYEEHGLQIISHSRTSRYDILMDFIRTVDRAHEEIYKELLVLDYYVRENAKTRPAFAGEETCEKEFAKEFYDIEEKERVYLPSYIDCDRRKLRKMTHIEAFEYNVLGELEKEKQYILFDYQKRNPLNHQAEIIVIK